MGLGKTVEAGICLLELIARGIGKRILLVVPPALIPQWLDEMWEKFGLAFQPIENSASLDRAQTALSEGLQPWAYFDRVITSTEYLKRRDIHASALAYQRIPDTLTRAVECQQGSRRGLPTERRRLRAYPGRIPGFCT